MVWNHFLPTLCSPKARERVPDPIGGAWEIGWIGSLEMKERVPITQKTSWGPIKPMRSISRHSLTGSEKVQNYRKLKAIIHRFWSYF